MSAIRYLDNNEVTDGLVFSFVEWIHKVANVYYMTNSLITRRMEIW